MTCFIVSMVKSGTHCGLRKKHEPVMNKIFYLHIFLFLDKFIVNLKIKRRNLKSLGKSVKTMNIYSLDLSQKAEKQS